MKKLIIVLIIAALAGGGWYYYKQSSQKAAPTVQNRQDRGVQKVKENAAIDREFRVEVAVLTDAIAVFRLQILDDFALIFFFFVKNRFHLAGTSFLPVTYS